MRVATKLSLAFGALVLLLVAAIGYYVRTTQRVLDMTYQLAAASTKIQISTSSRMSDLDRLEESLSKYVLTRDTVYLSTLQETEASLGRQIDTMPARRISPRAGAAQLQLQMLWKEYRARSESLQQTSQQTTPQRNRARTTAQLDSALDVLAGLRDRTRRVSDIARAELDDRLRRSRIVASKAERVALAGAAGSFLLGILFTAWILHSILESLRSLQQGTRHIADGNFGYRIAAPHEDEFAHLARDFNEMTEKLAELDRLKKEFLSKVSHDLKTPLASIREITRVLLDGLPGDLTAKQERLLALNAQSAEKLDSMITKVLDLSAIEAGAVPLDFQKHDLVQLTRESIGSLIHAMEEQQVEAVGDFPDSEVFVHCDAERLSRVVDNLLENAIKFSPAHGRINIGIRLLRTRPRDIAPEKWRQIQTPALGRCAALISVIDQGPGVPEADRERIFEGFFQTAGGRAVRNRGVGLGLAICREIVIAHGGAIWVKDAPTGGSCFHVLLSNATVVPSTHTASVAYDL